MANKDIRIRIKIDSDNMQPLHELNAIMKSLAASQLTFSQQTKAASAQLKNMAGAHNQAAKATTKVHQETQKANNVLLELGKTITHNIGKVALWGVATGILYGGLRSLSEAAEGVRDVDFELANLAKVMQSVEADQLIDVNTGLADFAKYAKVATAAAKPLARDMTVLAHQYGILGSEALPAGTEWARLQGSRRSTLEGMRATLLATAVAEMDAVEATKYLVAALKQFNKPATEATDILDQWNKLSNTYAVRAVDLAQGVSRAGAVTRQTGGDIAFLNAMITQLVESTGRAGTAIGTAIRTMEVYMYRAESIATIESLGNVVVQDSIGHYRAFEDVLIDLSSKWSTYSDAQKQGIAQAIAGTRRTTEFYNLIQNVPKILQIAAEAQDSHNSATLEAAILMDTLKKRTDQLHASMQMLAQQWANDALPYIKEMVSGLDAMVVGMQKVKGMSTLLAAVMLSFTGQLLLMNKAVVAFIVSIKTLLPELIVLSGIMAAVGGVTYYLGSIEKQRRESEARGETLLESEKIKLDTIERQNQALKEQLGRYDDIDNLTRTERFKAMSPEEQMQVYESAYTLKGEILKQYNVTTIADAWDLLNTKVEEHEKGVEDAISEYNKAIKKDEYRLQLYVRLEDALREQTKEFENQSDIKEKDVNIQQAILDISKETGKAMWDIKKDYEDILKGSGVHIPTSKIIGGNVGETLDELLMQFNIAINKGLGVSSGKSLETFTKVTNKVKELRENIQGYETAIDNLKGKFALIDEGLTTDEQKDRLQDIEQRIWEINEAYRVQSELMKRAGATNTELLLNQKEGLGKVIGMLEISRQRYAAYPDMWDDITKSIQEYNNKMVQANNDMKAAGLDDLVERNEKAIKKEIDAIKMASEYKKRYAEEHKDLAGVFRIEYDALRQQLMIWESYAALLDKNNIESKKATEEAMRLASQMSYLKKAYNDMIAPMERYNKGTELIKKSFEQQGMLGELRGENRYQGAVRRVQEMMRNLGLAIETGVIERGGREHQAALGELAWWTGTYLPELQSTLDREYRIRQEDLEKTRELTLKKYSMSDKALLQSRLNLLRDRKAQYISEGGLETSDEAMSLNAEIYGLETQIQESDMERRYDRIKKRYERMLQEIANDVQMRDVLSIDKVMSLATNISDLKRLGSEIGNIYGAEFSEAAKEELKQLNKDIADLNDQLLIEQKQAAWDMAAEYVDAFQSIRDSWAETLSNLTSSRDLESFVSQIDRMVSKIQQDVTTKLFKQTGMADVMAKLEMAITGGPASGLSEAEQRAELIRARMNMAGDYIAAQFVSAGMMVGNYIGGRVRSDMVTAERGYMAMKTPTGSLKGFGAKDTEPSNVGMLALSGVSTVTGTVSAYQSGSSAKQAIGTGIGSAIGTAVGYAVGTRLPGGPALWSAIGQAVGSAVGGAVAGDDDDDKKTVSSESLRDILGDTINRGAFQSAAQITYNIQNSYSLDFLIPDREQLRRVLTYLEKEKSSVDRNQVK